MLCSVPFLVSKRCLPSNGDYYRRQVSNRSTQAEARTLQLKQRRCMRTSDAPYRAMLSWHQMASFGMHPEGLDDLPQQRGTRESLCLVWCNLTHAHITSPGRGGGAKVGGGDPHVHHAQRMLHQLGATIWCRSVSVSV